METHEELVSGDGGEGQLDVIEQDDGGSTVGGAFVLVGDVREEDVGRVSRLTVGLACPLIGGEEMRGKAVGEEGVAEAALIDTLLSFLVSTKVKLTFASLILKISSVLHLVKDPRNKKERMEGDEEGLKIGGKTYVFMDLMPPPRGAKQ
jgi:hypothetical protein